MAVPVPRHVRSVAVYIHPLHHSGGILCPTIALHMNKSRAYFAFQGLLTLTRNGTLRFSLHL